MYAAHSTETFIATQTTLQADLDKIYSYGNQWFITFNPLKTVQQTFSLKNKPQVPKLTFGGEPVPVVEKHKHLGITISHDLKFKEHINQIIKKVNKTLSPVYPLAKFLPRTILNQIYTTYVRPHFDYCDIIYDGHITANDKLRLERLQNRAARLVTGTLLRTPTDKLTNDLGWNSLETRRKINKIVFFHNLLNNPSVPQFIRNVVPETRENNMPRALRHPERIRVPRHRTLGFKKSFLLNSIQQWNRLPQNVRDIVPKKKFKNKIRHILGTPPPPLYYSLGKKKENYILTRLRVGMGKLNAHQFQMQGAVTPHCACGHSKEDTPHYLLNCQLFNHARMAMFQEIYSVTGMNMNNIDKQSKLNIILHGSLLNELNSSKVAPIVFKYIYKTKRFD